MELFKILVSGWLGWIVFGPIGLVVGVFIASLLRNRKHMSADDGQTFHDFSEQKSNEYYYVRSNDFLVSLLELVAAVIRADGKVFKSELFPIKQVLLANYGEQVTLQALKVLRLLLNQNIDVVQTARRCADNIPYSQRVHILQLLYQIAAVDNEVSLEETILLRQIALNMALSQKDIDSITAMFTTSSNKDWAYDVLEIKNTATDDEVKKAYRQMAKRFHPDTVSALGESAVKTAEERFRKVHEAYDFIKKQRGML